MSTMITEVYNAFRKAGVPEQEAQDAAGALLKDSDSIKDDISSINGNINNIKKDIYELKADIKLSPYMLGLIIAILVIPFLKEIIS